MKYILKAQTGAQLPSGYNPRTYGTQTYIPNTGTIYDQNIVEGLYNIINNGNIGDLSSDKHLGGKEVNRYFSAKGFNANNLEKDTFKRYVNNMNNDKYRNSSQYKYDWQVLQGMLQKANEQIARYDPFTKKKIYYNEAGYDTGVSANDWQAANQQYTTARENYAKSLIADEYKKHLDASLQNDDWTRDGNNYGWDGKGELTQENAYKLINYAKTDNGLTLRKDLGKYSDEELKNFKFGDNSKKAFANALDYYKAYNPALYNAIVTNKGFRDLMGNSTNYEKIESLDFTDKGMKDWWEKTGSKDKKIVGNIDQQANSTENVRKYLEDQQNLLKQKSTPTQFTSANLTLFKRGGKMNKYQQGGQAPTAAQMVLQALSAAQQGDQSGLQQLFSDKKTAQAVIQQLQKEAQEGSEEAIQALEALKQIMSGSKKQATMAQKGAKLSYIHRLATGCPPGMEMTYFKKGGRICKACIEKAKKAKEGASLDNIIAKNKERYPGITDDQAAGRAPIRKNGKDYYLGGDGVLSEAPQKGKYGFGGFFEYFKCGGKPKKPKCGTKAKCGAELEKCGGKTPMDKCGGKTPMTKCGGKAPMDKCGGKTTLAKCGTELKKCGGKAKKSSPKKPVVNKDKCGGKAKKHAIGGNLELLKYMILNYNK